MNADSAKNISASLTLFVAIAFSPVLNASALDWPQWRGPNRDGISTESGWSTNWPKDGLKQLWKAEVGTGYGSVAISQGRLFVMGNTAEQDTVYCTWTPVAAKKSGNTPMRARPKMQAGIMGRAATPSVDGERVYTVTRQGHLFCLAAETGSVKWSRDFRKEIQS